MAAELTMLDLCSGIGGMSLGAALSCVRTVAFAEIEPFCCELLSYRFPGIPNLGDLYGISTDTVERLGRIDIVAGGIPCQPVSIAGKRRATADDRWLWPEMRRIVQLAQPTWVLIENVDHFVSLVLDLVSADLETDGYEVRAFVFPIAAVGAPHERMRVFVVGYRGERVADTNRDGQPQSCGDERKVGRWAIYRGEGVDDPDSGRRNRRQSRAAGSDQHASLSIGQEGPIQPQAAGARTSTGVGQADACGEGLQGRWTSGAVGQHWHAQSRVGRSLDGFSNWLDGYPWPAYQGQEQHPWEPTRLTTAKAARNRAKRVKAIGNSLSPLHVAPIFAAIVETEAERAMHTKANAL